LELKHRNQRSHRKSTHGSQLYLLGIETLPSVTLLIEPEWN
jgi:hypothetical protein